MHTTPTANTAATPTVTLTGDPAWLDLQYNNRARVPDTAQHLQRWTADSASAREQLLATGQAVLDVPYMDDEAANEGANEVVNEGMRAGAGTRAALSPASCRLDVFTPAPDRTPPPGGWPVLLFVHGGYWRALDKSDHSFLAPPWVAHGAIVVVPNYALCPAVSVSTITAQMQQAVGWTVRHISAHGGNPSRLTVVGHSAGGQQVGMLLSTDWAARGLPASPVVHGVSISGLFDMAPIRQTPFLADLHLSPDEARAQSPVHRQPTGGRLTAVVGGAESEEFLRQNRLLRDAWGEAHVPVCEALPGLNHFSVLEALADPASALFGSVADCLM